MVTQKTHQYGFTLVEMMMTLVIASVMLLIAYPSFVDLMQNQRAVTLANHFIGAVKLTRSEAIKRSSTVSLCPANAAQTACGTNWGNGWIIFVDPDNNGVLANSADRLKIGQALEPGASVTAPQGQAYLSFGAQGFVTSGAGSYTLAASQCEGMNSKQVTVTNSGRVEVSITSC